jgi:hypothetical protein
MESDVIDNNDIIDIKQLLNVSINDKYYEYIKGIIDKNVIQCSLLYTQVCYLIKLFLLYDYENNKNNNDYVFNEQLIRFCFTLIKNTKEKNKKKNNSDKEDSKDDKDNDIINKKNIDKNNIKYRLVDFFEKYNLDINNKYKFNCPNDLSSVSHITDALSTDIKTNILNNIKINYLKYVKEYIRINLKKDFKNNKIEITELIINSVYYDIISGSLNSDKTFHNWINEHKKLIIPKNNNVISILNLEDGIKNNYNTLNKFIKNYLNNDNILNDLIKINKIKNKKSIIDSIYNDLINNKFDSDILFHNWIKDNKIIIVSEFNKKNYIDLDKELNLRPYDFIPLMLFINRNLEINESKKKYQIIPLRTNLTPKFIPINIHSLVDILDSDYLLGKIKNYYHNNTNNGFILYETYFKFTSDMIKNAIKKGYVFSGLIKTNGYEVIFNFISKKRKEKKDNFHLSGKNEIKFIKESINGLTEEEKNNFKIANTNNKNKNKIKKKNKALEQIKEKKNKENQIKEDNKKKIKDNLELINVKYENELKLLSDEHYKNLNLELSKLDKGIEENKNKMNDIVKKFNEKLLSDQAFIIHCKKKDYDSLINDFENDVELKFNEIIKKDKLNDKKIEDLKKDISFKKKELKKHKKSINVKLDNESEKNIKNANKILNKNNILNIKIKRILEKIRMNTDLLNYETKNEIVPEKVKNIKLKLVELVLKINTIIFNLNDYLTIISNNQMYLLKEIIISKSTLEVKSIFEMCIKIISTNLSINYSETLTIKYFKQNLNFEKQLKKKENESKEYKEKYNLLIKSLEEKSKELNTLIKIKKNNEKELMKLFKTKNDEYMEIDNLSKKFLEILNKLNYALIDPGMGSIFTIMSKDGKKTMSYTKEKYLNRTNRKKIMKKIEKIKKEKKITELEKELTKENQKLKASNNYKNFNLYFQLKMNIHDKLTKLYNDDKLNKLKWFMFINEKRSESLLVNDIKKKFGNDVVLILGNWSMNKSGIKMISTPNKKSEKVLQKNFITLKIHEFRTSVIHNKTEKKCENNIKKFDIKKLNLKSIYHLEKLKEKNEKRYKKAISDKKIHKILVCKTNSKLNEYVNRDRNSVKNMNKIVLSLITENHKPKSYVMGTKICNETLCIM